MPGFDVLRRWFERLSYWQLSLARHSFVGLATLACAAAFWELFAARRDLITRLSIATAYPSLFLSLLAIALGPWNVLGNRANPVSFNLRRDLGIWAGIMALLHTGIGLQRPSSGSALALFCGPAAPIAA